MGEEQKKDIGMRERAEEKLDEAHEKKPEERVLLGHVRAAHGTGGLVKIESFTEPPENIAKYEKLRCDELGEGFVQLANLRQYKGAKGILAKILGCENRQQAETLRGAKLYIMKKDLPPLQEDCFYHQSLIGLPVRNESGKMLGKVATLQNFGAGELLEVQVKNITEENSQENNEENASDRKKNSKYNRKNERVFIPFSRDVVSRISESFVEVCGGYAEKLATILVEKQAQSAKTSLERKKKRASW